jgi:hypothetical protein
MIKPRSGTAKRRRVRASSQPPGPEHCGLHRHTSVHLFRVQLYRMLPNKCKGRIEEHWSKDATERDRIFTSLEEAIKAQNGKPFLSQGTSRAVLRRAEMHLKDCAISMSRRKLIAALILSRNCPKFLSTSSLSLSPSGNLNYAFVLNPHPALVKSQHNTVGTRPTRTRNSQ